MNIWEREKFYNADIYTPLLVNRDVLNILYKIAPCCKGLVYQSEIFRLRSEIKDLRHKLSNLEASDRFAQNFNLDNDVAPVRSGASAETQVHVDETKLSDETKRHLSEYIPAANRSFGRMSTLLDNSSGVK